MALHESDPFQRFVEEAELPLAMLEVVPDIEMDQLGDPQLDTGGDVAGLESARMSVELSYAFVADTPIASQGEDSLVMSNAGAIDIASEGQDRFRGVIDSIKSIGSKAIDLFNRPNVRTRPATREDVETLVDVDIKAFGSVYENYDVTPEVWRQELIAKFHGRLDKVTGDWMRVFERDGKIAGFITSCPTSKKPEDFVNWEETTDNGTLDSTFDPEGENIYVVSLSMVPEGSRIKGQNMLFGDQIGKFISEGYKQAFFESRMPGLRKWVEAECEDRGVEFDALTDDQKDSFAQEYFALRTEVKGKEVPHDRLLRIYDSVGCDLIKVVPNAYQDEPSMNYGVVCVFNNPLPESLRRNALASKITGGAVRLLAKSLWISKKLF